MDRTILLKGSFLHRRTFGWQDLIAVLIVVAAVILFGTGMHQMLVPLVPKHHSRFRCHRQRFRAIRC